MLSVQPGDVLLSRNQVESDYRFLGTEGPKGKQVAFLANLKRLVLPIGIGVAELQHKIDSGQLKVIPAGDIDSPPEDELSPRHVDIRDATWDRIKKIVTGRKYRRFFIKEGRGALITQHAQRTKVERSRIHTDLCRFFQGGMTKEGLIPKFAGGLRGVQQTSGKKRGRKRRDKVGGVPIYAPLRKKIENFILKLEARNRDVDEQYHEIVDKYFSEKKVDRSGRVTWVPLPPGERISRDQLNNIRHQLGKRHFLKARRAGPREYKSKLKGSSGSWDQEAQCPGAMYLLDNSGTQVELVSNRDRLTAIGTAIFFIVIDVFSKRIVGGVLSIENSKWESAASAIYYAISSKKYLFRRHKVDDDFKMYPAEGMPSCLGVDGASENNGDSSLAMIESTGIDVFTTRSWTGADKPFVERAISTFKTFFFRRLAGYRKKGAKPRGARNPKLDAVLTLFEVQTLFLDAILAFNRRPLPVEAISPRARLDGVRPTPNDIWAWGIEHTAGGLVRCSRSLLRTKLLREEPAKIKSDGVHYRRCIYTCTQFEELDTYSRARAEGGITIKVRIDPARPDIVWYRDAKSKKWIQLRRIDPDERFATWAHEDYLSEAAEHAVKVRAVREGNFARDHEDFKRRKSITEAAKAEQKAAGGRHTVPSTKKIRESRSKEKSLHRRDPMASMPVGERASPRGKHDARQSSASARRRARQSQSISAFRRRFK